jgi:hypothetical protein
LKKELFLEYGRELNVIPEPEIEIIEIEEEGQEKEEKKPRRIIVDRIIDEDGDLDINRVDFGEVRIADLRELHKKRIDVSKEEKRQEQNKIQERESLIEARKEDFRLLKEKESKDIDNILGGAELLNLDKVNEIDNRVEEKENKVDKLFDEAFKE